MMRTGPFWLRETVAGGLATSSPRASFLRSLSLSQGLKAAFYAVLNAKADALAYLEAETRALAYLDALKR